MFRTLAIAVATTTVLAGPSLAESVCSTAPVSKYQSQDTLKKQLQSQGMSVRQIKVEGGCYEVYALDKKGNQLNVAFNAETLAPVDNAEAGEN